MKKHLYQTQLVWTGNLGRGTQKYNSYDRDFDILINGKPTIKGSSDPAFLGDPTRHNPEDLFLSSISSCHALWYLHLSAQYKITVVSYEDQAEGEMLELDDGSGHFTKVCLYPKVQILEADKIELAIELHHEANKKCFIANSLNFQVTHKASVECK